MDIYVYTYTIMFPDATLTSTQNTHDVSLNLYNMFIMGPLLVRLYFCGQLQAAEKTVF